MFGIGLTFISTLLLVYILWRISTIQTLREVASKKTVFYSGVVIWIILVSGRLFGHGSGSQWASTVEFVGITITAVLFLIFTCLFPIDLATGFGRFFPRLAPRLRGWAVIGGCVLSLVATIQGIRPPVVSHHEVKLKNLPKVLDGTTLVALSDLHLGSTLGPRWLETRVAQVQELEPDIILLLGDIFEGHGENTEAFLPAFRKFSAPHGIWSVDGNHANHGKTGDSGSSLKGAHILTLQNELRQPIPGLLLAGRSVPRSHDEAPTTRPWNPPEDRPPGGLILLSHIPEDSQKAADTGVNLMLSGHTHGGQIWPFSFLVEMVHPQLGGIYKVDDMTLLVSRGTGTWGPRMRLWRPSEILHITLRCE
ncbi:MAG: metallophosphoesterase [Proteobacteria bacterium]|nr:metallophosphoesterase [Desulfocapsa sp.]MBU3945268.1 metallophosphoesterase [Pseudomonadota bacterium]MBU3982690.1 metallophosphoesterase [Pseudomonadota bacterium]MBU4028857.1 metallophosphoesterase [Pseudomonadota bacterium]MBU4042040.1 metallophosphoesterase [Pseudomonadota bacterium]